MSYIQIMFIDGDIAHKLIDIIESGREWFAVDYLSQWDYGTENDEAAPYIDGVYSEIPLYVGDRRIDHGGYILVYNAGLGHVNLYR